MFCRVEGQLFYSYNKSFFFVLYDNQTSLIITLGSDCKALIVFCFLQNTYFLPLFTNGSYCAVRSIVGKKITIRTLLSGWFGYSSKSQVMIQHVFHVMRLLLIPVDGWIATFYNSVFFSLALSGLIIKYCSNSVFLAKLNTSLVYFIVHRRSLEE